MGVMFDYFAAPDDAAAAPVIERGPDGSFETVPTGIDPVVLLGQLEELLGGRSFEELLEDPRAGGKVEMRGEGELLVLSISEETRDVLAAAGDADLGSVAREWSEAEEFYGGGDPAELEPIIRELSGLARQTREAGHGLYCWVCV